MKIVYDQSADDYGEFMVYHHSHSPATRHAIATQKWIGAIAGFAIGCLLIGPGLSPLPRLLTGVFLAAVFWGVFTVVVPGSFRTMGRKMALEGSGAGLLGRHELQIEDDVLIERSGFNEHRLQWAGVQRVVDQKDHVFIYIGNILAHIIPKRGILEGDLDAFVSEVKRRSSRATLKEIG